MYGSSPTDTDSLAFSGADAAATHADLLRVTMGPEFRPRVLHRGDDGLGALPAYTEGFLEKCPLKRLS